MDINKNTTTAKTLFHGNTPVGTSRVRVGKKLETNQGILVRAPGPNDLDGSDQSIGNTAVVYVGDSRVTADHSQTGGFPLCPGTAVVLPISDPSELYAIATKPNQVLQWIGL